MRCAPLLHDLCFPPGPPPCPWPFPFAELQGMAASIVAAASSSSAILLACAGQLFLDLNAYSPSTRHTAVTCRQAGGRGERAGRQAFKVGGAGGPATLPSILARQAE